MALFVIGATLNGSGTLLVRAERVGADSMLSQIVQMVSQAQRSRAPMQRLADRVAYWFVLVVLGGIDIQRVTTVRANLQDALDAATLAAASRFVT